MIWFRRIIFLVILALLGSCAASKQALKVEPSGFLDDYTILRQGKEGEALLVYKNPEADWTAYDKILLDPVLFWGKRETMNHGITPEQLQTLVNNFYLILYQELSHDYRMVERPGPNTLRIQAALTKVTESAQELDLVTTSVPPTRSVQRLFGSLAGRPVLTGEASLESKVTDSLTGELLGATVDRRIGSRTLDEAAVYSWQDVDNIMRFWAQDLRYRLCKGRGGANCREPEQ